MIKRPYIIIMLFVCAVSCNKHSEKNDSENTPATDSVFQQTTVDTLTLTLDALRNKHLPPGYKMTGDLKTDVLSFSGFRMEDAATYVFRNESGDEIIFNGNDTNFPLTVKSMHTTENNGGKDPNPVLLNKKFRVVWRRIRLDHKPQNETELYYQQFDQIIYMKEVR